MTVVREDQRPIRFRVMSNCALIMRNQLKRDRACGLKRLELKFNAQAVDALNKLAEARSISRSELIEEMLMIQLQALHDR